MNHTRVDQGFPGAYGPWATLETPAKSAAGGEVVLAANTPTLIESGLSKQMSMTEIVQELLYKGWTLEQIATETRSSLSSVYRWSHGLSQPRGVYVEKLKELLAAENSAGVK